MRRRILTGAAAGLTVTLALAACSSTGGQPPSSAASGRPLVVWVDEARAGALADLAARLGAEGLDVEVVARTSETLRQDYVQAETQSEGPDALVGAHDWLGELVTQGVVQPADLAEPEEFAPAAVEAMTYDGVTYGTPLSIESIALVRNDALVTTTPATFDEVVAQGAELVRAGRATRPLLVQQGEGGDPYHLYPLQTSFGAPAFRADEDGSGTAAFVAAGMRITVLPVPPAADLPAQPFVGVQGAFINNLSTQQDEARAFVSDFLAEPAVQLALYRATSRAPALTAALDQITDDPVTTGFAQAGAQGAPMPATPQMGLVWLYWGSTEAAIAAGGGHPAVLWDQMVANIEASIAAEL